MLSVTQIGDETYIVDDGTAPHTYTSAQDMRTFVLTHQALEKQFPNVTFTLADDTTITSWVGAAPQPTFAQVVAGVAAHVAAQNQEAANEAELRTRVRTLVQSSVGVQIDQLTAAQVRALVIVLLQRQGAVSSSGVIRPLRDWE